MLMLLHSGQTGVERGAQRAAAITGLPIAGFCTLDRRDEIGHLPPAVARDLTPCLERGPRVAAEANLAIASGLVVVVPDARRLSTFTGMSVIARSARARCLPHAFVDPSSKLEDVINWICGLPATSDATRIFVTGPRATRWTEGDRLGWQLVASLAQRLGYGDTIGGSRETVALTTAG